MKPKSAGMTLIELMIVVAIVALLASIAVPSYRQYVLRANRIEATTALLQLAAAQEKFYLQNNTYAGNALIDDAPPAGLGLTCDDRRRPLHGRDHRRERDRVQRNGHRRRRAGRRLPPARRSRSTRLARGPRRPRTAGGDALR